MEAEGGHPHHRRHRQTTAGHHFSSLQTSSRVPGDFSGHLGAERPFEMKVKSNKITIDHKHLQMEAIRKQKSKNEELNFLELKKKKKIEPLSNSWPPRELFLL